jgi:hypothetical protein
MRPSLLVNLLDPRGAQAKPFGRAFLVTRALVRFCPTRSVDPEDLDDDDLEDDEDFGEDDDDSDEDEDEDEAEDDDPETWQVASLSDEATKRVQGKFR